MVESREEVCVGGPRGGSRAFGSGTLVQSRSSGLWLSDERSAKEVCSVENTFPLDADTCHDDQSDADGERNNDVLNNHQKTPFLTTISFFGSRQ